MRENEWVLPFFNGLDKNETLFIKKVHLDQNDYRICLNKSAGFENFFFILLYNERYPQKYAMKRKDEACGIIETSGNRHCHRRICDEDGFHSDHHGGCRRDRAGQRHRSGHAAGNAGLQLCLQS